ncbi:MAG: hypothetical protein KDA41_21835 [Planctomycetales bacterium]|nr:hypothetical protein [Planctomycetales bacterium]
MSQGRSPGQTPASQQPQSRARAKAPPLPQASSSSAPAAARPATSSGAETIRLLQEIRDELRAVRKPEPWYSSTTLAVGVMSFVATLGAAAAFAFGSATLPTWLVLLVLCLIAAARR